MASPRKWSASSTIRTAPRASRLIQYADGEKSYILAPDGLTAAPKSCRVKRRRLKLATRFRLSAIPLGSAIHNIEIAPGRGGQIARSAGQQATLSNREAGYALVKLPSGEIRRIHETCCATMGQVGNVDHMNVVSGKAGRSRWQGIRPTVRGMVMNPIDHPNGGGQGKSKGGGGRQHLTSPWGQLAKGFQDPLETQAERPVHHAGSTREQEEEELIWADH